MTHAELKKYDAEIRALFRGWVEMKVSSCPDWMTSEEYELIHKCIREAYKMSLEKAERS